MTGMVCAVAGGGGLRALAANITPASLSGSSSSSPVSSNSAATCNVQGGLAPFTYAWSRVSGANFTILSPGASATFFQVILPPGSGLTMVAQCLVTDALGATVAPQVPIDLERF